MAFVMQKMSMYRKSTAQSHRYLILNFLMKKLLKMSQPPKSNPLHLLKLMKLLKMSQPSQFTPLDHLKLLNLAKMNKPSNFTPLYSLNFLKLPPIMKRQSQINRLHSPTLLMIPLRTLNVQGYHSLLKCKKNLQVKKH